LLPPFYVLTHCPFCVYRALWTDSTVLALSLFQNHVLKSIFIHAVHADNMSCERRSRKILIISMYF